MTDSNKEYTYVHKKKKYIYIFLFLNAYTSLSRLVHLFS